MAKLERLPAVEVPAVSDPPSFTAADATGEAALRRAMESFRRVLTEVVSRVNGVLTLGKPVNGAWSGNIDGQWITGLVFKGTDELTVPHGLGRVPYAVLPVITADMTDGEATIYASPTSAWTPDMVFLQKTGAGDRKVTVLVL